MAKTITQLKAQIDNVTKPETAEQIATNANVDSISDVIKRVGATMDTEKAKCSVALLNVFSLAIKAQAGRTAWNARDFMAFGVALSAMEQIAPDEPDYTGGRSEEADGTHAVARALGV